MIVLLSPMLSTGTADNDRSPFVRVTSEPTVAMPATQPPPGPEHQKSPAVVLDSGRTAVAVAAEEPRIPPRATPQQDVVDSTPLVPRPRRRDLDETTLISRQEPRVPAIVQSAGAGAPRATFVGTLSVECQVAGAQIYIDGKAVAVTPLVGFQLSAGSHVVRLELAGYDRWSTVVQIVTGQTVNLVATLQAIERH